MRTARFWCFTLAVVFLSTVFLPRNFIFVQAARPTYPLTPTPVPRVIGGTAVSSGTWPWMAALIDRADRDGALRPFCGASLIAPEWLVTAAHCVIDELGEPILPNTVQVVFGRKNITSLSGERIDVRDVRVYPLFDVAEFYDGDVALLQLARPVTNVVPITLASPSQDTELTRSGKQAVVLGWGSTVFAEQLRFPEILQQVTLPLIDQPSCVAMWNGALTERQLCAGEIESGGIDACEGDSGGPLLGDQGGNNWTLIGLVSYGTGCGSPAFPGVYTRISSMAGWIEAQLGSSAHLALTQRVPIVAAPNEAVDIVLTAANTASQPLRNILLTTTVPSNTQFVLASTGGKREGSRISWAIKELAVGATRDFVLTVRPQRSFQPGQLQAQGVSSTSISNYRPLVRVNEPQVLLTLDGPSQVALNSVFTYTVELENTGLGPRADAQNLVLTAAIPSGLTAVAAPGGQIGANEVRWELAALPVDEIADFALQVRATQLGQVIFDRARVVPSNGTARASDTLVTTRVGAAELQAALSGPTLAAANTPVTYTLTITNNGDLPAYGLTISLPLPVNATYLSSSADGENKDGSVRWTRGQLAPQSSAMYQVTVQGSSDLVWQNYGVTANDAQGSVGSAIRTVISTQAGEPTSPVSPVPTTSPVPGSTTYQYLPFVTINR